MVGSQLFPCMDGAPFREDALRTRFTRLGERAGVPRLHIHLLRHTFATWYLLNERDAFSLQQILGHSTLEMTRNYTDMVAVEKAVVANGCNSCSQDILRKGETEMGLRHGLDGTRLKPRKDERGWFSPAPLFG